MTSKISFINLRRENIKHRIGMIFVTFFFFFLSVLGFLMNVQNICGVKDSRFEDNLIKITALSEPGPGRGLVAIGAAVLLAISSFRYLHSKTEVDFYHSLPVRRREYLYLILTNDIMLFTALLVLTSAFECIVTAAVGYFTKAFLVNTLWSAVCFLAVFAVTYLTMSLAMLMTGSTFIGILGFGVLSGYSPVMLYYLYPSLASTFFVTYCADKAGGEIFNYFSPLSLAKLLLFADSSWKCREHIVPLAVIGIWAAVLLVVNYLVFERRPLEMAGRAMAFPQWNPVIRFLLVIPAAVYVGLGLYAVSFTSFKPWIIAGVIIGGFFAHGVIECIYQFDVRGLWSNKRQMLASVGAAFVIVGFFWADVGGYDTYIPKEEEVASIMFDEDSSFWGKDREGVTGETAQRSLEVLKKVVSENDENLDIYNNGSISESAGYRYYTVTYKLKGGKSVKRIYVFSAKLQDELMEQIFDTMEYKKDAYSLYTADWSLVTDVQVSYPVSTEMLDLTKEQRAELFRAYLEDHSALDYKTAKSTLPFGQLLIEHRSARDYGHNSMGEITEQDAYYLYPSFKKTISYLRDELKIDLKTSMKDIPVTHLEVSRNADDSDEQESFDIYDKEFIDSIKDKLCCGEYMWTGGFEQAIDMTADLMATVTTEAGEESFNVYTDPETMEKIKQQGTFE